VSLIIKNLEVAVGAFTLKVPSLQVRPGEIAGLMGKSGSGKSTLLSALGGFLPGSGELLIEGENRTHFYPERRRLAYVFQKNTLFPHLSVERNVAFPLEVAKQPREQWKPLVAQWLERFGIAALASRKPDEISGGEAQRVALARALVSGFKVVLFDEPFSALDPSLRRDLRTLVKTLVGETGLSVLWVTHDLDDVSLFSHVTVLEKGNVAWQGNATDLPKEKYF